MQIISFSFLAFLLFVFGLLYFVGRWVKDDKKSNSISNWILLTASYIFVLYADYRFAAVLLLITLSTWLSAKKSRYSIGIVFALLALGYFKYTNFFIESFSKLLGIDGTRLNIILPLGISFYVFSAIGYICDVKRGKMACRSFEDVALYLSFFPKLTSGPLQSSKDFFEQIEQKRNVGWETFSAGIQIFVFGLFKKLVLADRLSVFVNQVYATPRTFASLTVFLAMIAYSFQIYFDFSGYSDMAIGVARIIGVKLPRNFNLPYLAHNVTELWKRWHITLSAWLQKYVYISLGGNRKGKCRTYINLILTMLIGGIWHGANWTYIIWGLLHGAALAVHKVWMEIKNSQNKTHSAFFDVFSIALTFCYTSFCWIFFRAENFDHAMLIIRRICCLDSGVEQIYFWLPVALSVYFAGVAFALVRSKKNELSPQKKNVSRIDGYYPVRDLSKFKNLVIFFVFCGLIICFAYTGGSPFIYGSY